MAVSAVLRLAQWHEPHPSEPRYPPPYTGGTPVPLSKSPKAAFFWYYIRFVRFKLGTFCDNSFTRVQVTHNLRFP